MTNTDRDALEEAVWHVRVAAVNCQNGDWEDGLDALAKTILSLIEKGQTNE